MILLKIPEKEIRESCKQHGLSFRKNKNSFVISTYINNELIKWKCKNIGECAEALFQAKYLKNKNFS